MMVALDDKTKEIRIPIPEWEIFPELRIKLAAPARKRAALIAAITDLGIEKSVSC